ncbi:MAG: class II glutamine amidotransferase [Actinocatenispora sp.]
MTVAWATPSRRLPEATEATMCRLFGMSSAPRRADATFWLLDAPDSLLTQSQREPDGTGLGTFDENGDPDVERWPIAAYQDKAFISAARDRCATTFIAHIRYASQGPAAERNTHPFRQRDRLFAHNGVLGGLDLLERELGDDLSLVRGDTDSERFFALITRYAEEADDVTAAITRAARWAAANLPLYALNIVMTTATDLWALRYPDTHPLYLLRRDGDENGTARLHHVSPVGTLQVHCGELVDGATVVASERMDDDPGWRLLRAGELVHVDGSGRLDSHQALTGAPRYPLRLTDLGSHAAASQTAAQSAAGA